MNPLLPADPVAVAFKEWAGVCAALSSGRQAIILRKGGVEEGPGGFSPEHPAFWLYPTFLHEGEQGLKWPSGRVPPADPGVVPVDTLAVVESVRRVDSAEFLPRLDPLHAWTEETARKRFDYRSPGLWVLGVRIYRRPEPARLAVTPAYLGCKSWVPLDEPIPVTGLVPVRTEAEAEADRERLADALHPAPGRAS